MTAATRFMRRFDTGFDRFRTGPFRQFVGWCVRWRYATVSCAIAILLLSVGLTLGGRVGFHFFACAGGRSGDWQRCDGARYAAS